MTDYLTSIVFCAGILALPASGWAQDTGAAAFAAKDYERAEQLWLQEVATRSATATASLGALKDSGLRGDADPRAAFGWYLTAAGMGLAEAQMTVALSYDAAIGQDRNLEQALQWYTRAALRGHKQAQFNLGVMFASGDSGSVNPDQAAFWLDQADADWPAQDVVVADGIVTPEIVFGAVNDNSAEVIWNTAVSAHQQYQLEVLDVTDDNTDYQPPILLADTKGTGILLTDVSLTDRTIWRVINPSANEGDYRATPWQGAADASLPAGRITLLVDRTVPGMAEAAAVFAQDFRAAGYWVRQGTTDANDTMAELGTYISFGYQSDLALADRVAGYLPGPRDGVGYVQMPGTTRPGEIIIHLSGAPDASE